MERAVAIAPVTDIDTWGVPCVHPDKVDAARVASPARHEIVQLTSLFKLLGDPTRARILYAVLEAGEMCVCDIAATLGATETTVSQALRLLRAAEVVATRRDGRMIYYRLADSHVQMLLDLSREHARHQTES
jgi:ArsR family transcriptional regulator, lead/cadmium/zinc/bismuth-responsive transcriptional repressor